MRILEMPEKGSDAPLVELKARAANRKFRHAHKGRAGNLLMWDGCATQHKTVPNDALPQRRVMERTTLLSAAAIGMLAEHCRQWT